MGWMKDWTIGLKGVTKWKFKQAVWMTVYTVKMTECNLNELIFSWICADVNLMHKEVNKPIY